MVNYYMQTLDDLSEMVIIEDAVGTIKYVNQAFCRFHGVTREQVTGRSVFDFILPEDREACAAHNWVSPENSKYKIEGRSKRSDGKVAWIQYIGNAFFSEDGELQEFQELAIDITRWKEELNARTAELEKVSRRIQGIREATSNRRGKTGPDGRIGNTASYTFQDILTCTSSMNRLKSYAMSVAEGDSSVLIEGESGTGKELFAQSIHNSSKRSNGPFVAVNCGAIPAELIQSEFFGYEEGAFTGAVRGGKKGKFELASGGTLFLDEIGEMPMAQQTALLRVLETKKISRVGGGEEIPVDIRLVCATNKDLMEECRAGRFRKDLYYRINIIHLDIPPLRERREDIFLLIGHFIRAIGNESFPRDVAFNDEQLIRLYHYDWPGNVRELKNVVERIRFGADADVGELLEAAEKPAAKSGNDLREHVREIEIPEETDEEGKIRRILAECEGNVSMAARKLGVSRNTMYKKIRKYGLQKR